MRRTFSCLTALLVVACALNFASVSAHAQNASAVGNAIDYQKSGIRFQIWAAIKAAPPSLYSKNDDDGTISSLTVKLRISAHARESDYYGEIAESFSDFRLTEGSAGKLFWQDARCHQRRGFPKTTVTAIDGSITKTDGSKIDVQARPRHLGKLLPSDEISAGKRMPGGADENGKFIAFRSETKASHLAVEVKVYVADCVLADAAPPADSPEGRRR